MTGADFVCLEALELPHRPSEQRQIDVPEHRGQCRRRVAPVVFDPPARSGVSLRAMSASDSCVRCRMFKSRIVARMAFSAEELTAGVKLQTVPRFESSGPAAVGILAEGVEPDGRICTFALFILAVDDRSLGGMQLQPAVLQLD